MRYILGNTKTLKLAHGGGRTSMRAVLGQGPTGPEGPPGLNADGTTADQAMQAIDADPASAYRVQADARLGETTARVFNALTFTPGVDAATNATVFQSVVDQAIAEGRDLYIQHVGEFPLNTVVIGGAVRIYGQGRGKTVVKQGTIHTPVFHVTGEGVTVEDFTGRGNGLDFPVGFSEFSQNGILRVERYAHGFTARRIGGENIYNLIVVRPYPDPAPSNVVPTRIERFVVEDVLVENVWCAVGGGPFDSPRIENVRGNIVPVTGHAETEGHAPHLVYLNSPTPLDGVMTDGHFTRGGTVTHLSAWDGPDYIGAAFSFKWCRGIVVDAVTARGYRGVIELQGVEDSTFGIVSSMEDKFPAIGTDSTRAVMSLNTCKRVRVKHLSVDFAPVDHGRALRFEANTSDCEVEHLTVVERSPVDRRTGDVSFAVQLQGAGNVVRNADITNLGAPKWCAVSVTATGTGGRLLNPRIGAGYSAHVRVAATHTDALIDYDPIHLTPDRTITSVRLDVDAAARCTVRDRSLGQPLPAGFVDEFDRGVVVAGLATTDDGKDWKAAGNWGTIAVGSGNWTVNTTEVKYTGGGARELAVVDGVTPNGTLETTIGVDATGQSSGIAGRVSDWNNFIGLEFNWGTGDGRLNLMKRVGGTKTDIAQSGAVIAAGSVVALVMAGTAVSVTVDGVQVIAPQTVTDHATATHHGLLHAGAETALTYQRVEFTPS